MTTPYLHVLNCVLAREGTVDRARWPTPCSLHDVMNTFNLVGREIASHDKRRQVVSRAWMMYLLHDAIHRWIYGKFHRKHTAFKKVGDVARSFAMDIIIPKLEMKPKVTMRSYSLGHKYAPYLKALESSEYASLVPFSIDAFSVGIFSDMTSKKQTEVLRLVEGDVSKESVPLALKAYLAGERPNADDADGKVNKVDIYYAPGKRVTAVRDSDNFVDITSILKVSGGRKCCKSYKRAKGTPAFLSSFTCASNKSLICEPSAKTLDSYWAHYKVAIHVAEYCKAPYDLAALLAHLPDDTMPTDKVSVRGKGLEEAGASAAAPESVRLDEIRDEDGSPLTHRRATDHFVDVSQLSERLPSTWYEYHKLERARLFREDLAYELCVDANTLVQTPGAHRRSSTFVHMQIAVDYIVCVTGEDITTVRERLCGAAASHTDIEPIMDAESGKWITDRHSADGFYNATMMSHASGLTRSKCSLRAWFNTPDGSELKARAEKQVGGEVWKSRNGLYGGTYLHPLLAIPYAARIGLTLSSPTDTIVAGATTSTAAYAVISTVPDQESSAQKSVEDVAKPTAKATSNQHAASFCKALQGDDGEMIVELRHCDGFVNATRLCKSAGKKWSNYFDTDETRRFLNTLSEKAGVPANVLVESTPGRCGGTFVHPQVAINLASRCSAEFAVQVTDLVHRYSAGQITTEECEAVEQCLQAASNSVTSDSDQDQATAAPLTVPITTNVIVGDAASPSTSHNTAQPVACREIVVHKPTMLDDIVCHKPDMDTVTNPWHTWNNNVCYILSIGSLASGVQLCEWGRTANFPERRKQHSKEFPGCQIIMIIDVGTHSAKPLEDCMKAYFSDHHNSVRRPTGTYNVECFRGPSKADEAEYFGRFQNYVESGHGCFLRYITPLDGKIKAFNGHPLIHPTSSLALEGCVSKAESSSMHMQPWTMPAPDTTFLLAAEATKQAEELTKQECEKTKQTEACEKTKQMQQQVEMMKLRIEMHKLGVPMDM